MKHLRSWYMDKQPILSICIPTYNQPLDFQRTLKSILPQISRENTEVEILVGDNSINSETEEIIHQYSDFPYLRYYRHGKNLGIDKNILFLIEKSHGKYIWLFGDDEMRTGTIEYVLSIIKKYPELSLIWVNLQGFDQEQPHCSFGGDRFFENGSQVLEEIGIGLNFLPTLILKREKLLNIDKENMKKFIGSDLINLYLPLFILSQEGKFYCINHPYVIAHGTPLDKISYDYFQMVGVSLYLVIKNFQKEFNKKSIKKISREIFGCVWRAILVGWLKGYDTPKGKLRPMFKFYWNFPEFWLAAPFFLMPKFVTKFAYFVYKKILMCPSYSTVRQKYRKSIIQK